MRFSDYIKRLSWKQILFHIIGTIFLVFAVQQFLMLNDMEILKYYDKYGVDIGLKLLFEKYQNMQQRITYYIFWITLAPIIGILIGFLISIILEIIYKRFWLNSLVMLVLMIIINRLGFFQMDSMKVIFLSFGKLFNHLGLQFKFIANGALLLLIGYFLFFSKLTKNIVFKN